MKIGIDITPLIFKGSGVANYTYNLVKNLLDIDKKNEYSLFFTSPRINKKFAFLDEFKNLGAKIYRFPYPFMFFQLLCGKLNIIPIEWFIGKVDFFISSDILRPPASIKTFTTIHDLIWKIYPQYHEEFIVKAHEDKIKKIIERGDEIISDSISTRYDLIKYFPHINKYQIHVIYPGIGEQFQSIKDIKKIAEVLKRYTLHAIRYILYVGAIEPRKNLDKAIEVFNELIKDKKYKDFHFLIIGSAGWKNERIYKLTSQLGLEDKVKFVGFVKDEDLPYFYSGAKLTVYLSSYEGFGIPPLESLACGTPVLAGDNSSLKETLPQKFLVDVENKGKILEKMNDLLKTKHEINSDEFKKRFQWKESAKRYLEIISGSV